MASLQARFSVPAAFAAILAAAAGTASARAIDLDEALRLGTERAPSLSASAAREVAASQTIASAAALPDPRLTFGISDWPVTGPDAFDLRADDMTSQQIGLMQEFPARAKREAQRSIARAQWSRAQDVSVAERATVRQRVAQAWFALWSAQAQREALEALRETSDIAERTARARLSGGSGSASETLAIQATALALENRIEAAQGDVESAAAGLARWVDGEADPPTASGTLPDLRQLRIAEDRLLANLDQLAPLLPWAGSERVAEAEVDAALAQKRPDYGLALSYGRRDRSPEGGSRSDMLMLEFSVGLPLFARNRQDRTIAARRADLDAAVAERDEARREQRESLRRTLADWRAQVRQLDRIEHHALPLAHDRSAVALAAYGAGGELQPWIDARRDEIELTIEHARLQGELGRIWAALAWLLPDEVSTP